MVVAAKRARGRLDQLFVLGESPHACRPGLSDVEEHAFSLVERWMRSAGLEISYDAVGNLFARLLGRSRGSPEVWLGSHLDTVPGGGRFDGALGVVAALEVAERLRGNDLGRSVVAVAFRDEEGWRFGRSCFGSRALCGLLERGELDAADADGITVREALSRLGRSEPPSHGWLERRPAAFLELHVEQGPVLAQAGVPLGIVNSIVGISEFSLTFDGRAGHAGTNPMGRRADALSAAANLIVGLQQAAARTHGVATVGQLSVSPGTSNVIPSRVVLSADLRAAHANELRELEQCLLELAQEAATVTGCEAHVSRRWHSEPTRLSAPLIQRLSRAAEELELPWQELASGAGHDAGIIASAGVDTGMLFVPSLNGGASHVPEEDTDTLAIADALAALTLTVRRLANIDGDLETAVPNPGGKR
jgi:hydantoinase/carbamoylase family amidase